MAVVLVQTSGLHAAARNNQKPLPLYGWAETTASHSYFMTPMATNKLIKI